MFKKYLCLSTALHLLVLWGVGRSLPPSPTGKQEPIVLEFTLDQPPIGGNVDLVGAKQEREKAFSEVGASSVEEKAPPKIITPTRISEPPRTEAIIERGEESPDPTFNTAIKKEESLLFPEKDSVELSFQKETSEADSETNLFATGGPPKSGNFDALAEEGTCTAPGTGIPSSAEQAEGGAENLEPARRPVLVKHKNPFYPLIARKKGWEGTVTFQIKLDQSGKVSAVALLESSGYEILDEEAAKSVGAWLYEPAANQDGNPIDCLIKVKITFALQN